MAIEINCPECQALLRLDDDTAGRQARCPNCSAVFPVVAPATPESPAPLGTAAPLESGQPAVHSDATNPYAPTSYTDRTVQLPTEWAPRQITPEEVFSKAWAIFKVHWMMACVAIVIVGGINFVLNMVSNGVMQVLAGGDNDPAVILPVQFFLSLGTTLIQFWLQIGQTMVMLDIARGREVVISKIFGGGPLLVKTILVVILVSLIMAGIMLVVVGLPAAAVGLVAQNGQAAAVAAFVGFLIAIVPIVYVSLMYSQAQVLIVDRGVGPVEALRLSKEITDGNKLPLLLIFLLLGLIGIGAFIVGLLALCVGVIPSLIAFGAYSALLLVVTYLCMTGQSIAVPQASIGQGQPGAPAGELGG